MQITTAPDDNDGLADELQVVYKGKPNKKELASASKGLVRFFELLIEIEEEVNEQYRRSTNYAH